MNKLSGWWRLWFVTSTIFVVIGSWSALSVPDTRPEVSGKTCVSGTQITATDFDRVRNPTDSEISAKRIEIRKDLTALGVDEVPDSDIEFNAHNLAEQKIMRSAEYIKCVSVERFVGQIGAAVFAALGLFPLFIIARWVARAFRLNEK